MARAENIFASCTSTEKKISVQTEEYLDTERESNLNITLLQGISKGDRMDYSIQKAVELGVSRIIPVHCQRTVVNLNTERLSRKHQHWRGIVTNACEQSGRNRIPQLNTPIKFSEIFSIDIEGLKLTLDPLSNNHLQTLQPDSAKICLLIGPEGGLSNVEIQQASNNGFVGISLGSRILRTETATLAAIAALQTEWGDFR